MPLRSWIVRQTQRETDEADRVCGDSATDPPKMQTGEVTRCTSAT